MDMIKYESRKKFLLEFLSNIFIPEFQVSFEIRSNNEDNQYTYYEVILSNNFNDKRSVVVIGADDEGELLLEVFEEFDEVDKEKFLLHLFLLEFNCIRKGE